MRAVSRFMNTNKPGRQTAAIGSKSFDIRCGNKKSGN